MTALEKAKELLTEMTPEEKAKLVHWAVDELTGYVPGIEKTPGVCGGDACIAGTRIPVWLLIRQRQLGITEEETLYGYPQLKKEDLENAWNYYARHKNEIEEQIRENEEA